MTYGGPHAMFGERTPSAPSGRDRTEHGTDVGGRGPGVVEVGPNEADAPPTSQPADHVLALLLPEDDVSGRLPGLQQTFVLDLAIELQEHAVHRPREVDPRHLTSVLVAD